jgi:hypothetical protein
MTNGNVSDGTVSSLQVRRAAVKGAVQSLFGLIGYGVVLFLPAGRLDWAWGWVLLGIVTGVRAGQPRVRLLSHPRRVVEGREERVQDPT